MNDASNAHVNLPSPLPMPEGRLAVAVSGGVDSLCSLLTCVQAGRECVALHAIFNAPATPDEVATSNATIAGLERACKRLCVPLHVVDVHERFASCVVNPFAAAYRQGLTPNPCALCNKTMKFGALCDVAKSLGCAHMVTGHYAAIVAASDEEALPMLARGQDATKDQSYFLSLVPRKRLAHTWFALARQNKAESRAMVAAAGLDIPVPTESQEICFIPPGPDHYRKFLSAHWASKGLPMPQEGPVLLVADGQERKIGTHLGLWRYTEGQRQGLGIAWSEPIYVIGKDAQRNALLVGTREATFMHGAIVQELNLMVAPKDLPKRALVRLRYRQKPAPASLELLPDGSLRVLLDTPASLSAPGQVCCVTNEAGLVLAGGIISRLL